MVSCGNGQASITPTPTLSLGTTQTIAGERTDLEKYFQRYSGSFVIYDLKNDRTIRYNSQKSSERLLPASTFKIMSSLIGLETGVIPDENYLIPWDGTRYPNPAWNQDQTMKSAFQNSVVWYYQELARSVGAERMQHYVDLVGYGNRDISGEIDSFWLVGGLLISADQQIEFLKRLYRSDLPFSARNINIVKNMMVLEDSPAYRLSGKTGSTVTDTNVGWFIGYLEKGEQVYFFATDITGTDPQIDGKKAKEITLDILTGMSLYNK